MNKKLLSTIEVARILGISRVAVFKKIKAGRIKAAKLGRNYFIERDELPRILGTVLSEDKKREISAAVKKTVREYKTALRLLGQE
jgi:excisionase family DNA binding protein